MERALVAVDVRGDGAVVVVVGGVIREGLHPAGGAAQASRASSVRERRVRQRRGRHDERLGCEAGEEALEHPEIPGGHGGRVGDGDDGGVLDEVDHVLGGEESVVDAAQHEFGEVDGADHGDHVLQQRLAAGVAEVGVEQRAEQQGRRSHRGAGLERGDDVDAVAGTGPVEHESVHGIGGRVGVGSDRDAVAVRARRDVGGAIDGAGALPGDDGDAPVSEGRGGAGRVGHAPKLSDNRSH